MATYAEKTSQNIIVDACSDPEGDPLVLYRLNGTVIGSWPHDFTGLGSGDDTVRVYQNGDVEVLDGGTTTGFPAGGESDESFYSFTFTCWDGGLESSPATATIALDGNQPPSTTGDSITRTAGVTSGLNVLNLSTDPEGQTMQISGTPTADSGGVIANVNAAAGTFDYTPDVAFTGTETISYTIEDNLGATVNGTITVTVQAPSAFSEQAITWTGNEWLTLNESTAGAKDAFDTTDDMNFLLFTSFVHPGAVEKEFINTPSGEGFLVNVRSDGSIGVVARDSTGSGGVALTGSGTVAGGDFTAGDRVALLVTLTEDSPGVLRFKAVTKVAGAAPTTQINATRNRADLDKTVGAVVIGSPVTGTAPDYTGIAFGDSWSDIMYGFAVYTGGTIPEIIPGSTGWDATWDAFVNSADGTLVDPSNSDTLIGENAAIDIRGNTVADMNNLINGGSLGPFDNKGADWV